MVLAAVARGGHDPHPEVAELLEERCGWRPPRTVPGRVQVAAEAEVDHVDREVGPVSRSAPLVARRRPLARPSTQRSAERTS